MDELQLPLIELNYHRVSGLREINPPNAEATQWEKRAAGKLDNDGLAALRRACADGIAARVGIGSSGQELLAEYEVKPSTLAFSGLDSIVLIGLRDACSTRKRHTLENGFPHATGPPCFYNFSIGDFWLLWSP